MKTSKYVLTISSFDVDIVFRSDAAQVLKLIPSAMESGLGGLYSITNDVSAKHAFDVEVKPGGRIDIYQNGELKYVENDLNSAMSRIEACVRLKVAEFAVGKVFIHSGAVAWKGKGIIFPARSFNGKSTLTAALVRQGARYFSDEYAIIDDRARLHPFPKDISLRDTDGTYDQVDHPVRSIGGRVGKRPVPVKLIVLTRFEKNAKWRPKRISEGQAVLGVLNNAVGIRRDPSFVLPVLTNLSKSAIAIKSKRGDADNTAEQIIQIVESLDN